MSTRETKACIESGMDEWKRNLETMKAKNCSAARQTDVKYRETGARLQEWFGWHCRRVLSVVRETTP